MNYRSCIRIHLESLSNVFIHLLGADDFLTPAIQTLCLLKVSSSVYKMISL